MTNETRTPSPADRVKTRVVGHRERRYPGESKSDREILEADLPTLRDYEEHARTPSPADGQRLWRDIKTAPDNELIFVWDYGTIRQSMRKDGAWISEWEGIPPPGFPTLWLPMFPYPDGADV